MNALANLNLSKTETETLKAGIVEILSEDNFLGYSKPSYFEEKIKLALQVKKFYCSIALNPHFEIDDIIKESGHTLATLAAANGYDFLMCRFKERGVDLTRPAPNGLTPAAAAWNGRHQKVLNKLEDLGIPLGQYSQPVNSPYVLHHTP
ncbi:MAG: hypothetical protein DYH13_05230 [Alphaproteobacteria bacterium PRO2]|nr:hypothetical protein [Alphaproteobacteria bacterium PRO2]